MPYDEEIAAAIRRVTADEPDVEERRMFGGVAFLVDGRLAVAASGQGGLLARVDPDELETLVAQPHVEPFEMRGRPMQGWIHVDADGVRTEAQLAPWVARGLAYARSLPGDR